MKYLLFLAIKSQGKKARGFTLIELLVVVIILGVLAAVGLPNLLGQVAKSRQAEAIAILGQINRAQQIYRLENDTFARLAELPINGIGTARFYTFRDYTVVVNGTNTPNAIQSAYGAEARDPFGNEIRNYAGGVRLLNMRFGSVICQALTPLQDNVFVNPEGGCTNGYDITDPSSPPQTNPINP